MRKLAGRVAVITGASRGIGKGIALAFAREGASVVVAARNAESLQQVVSEIEQFGGAAKAFQTDVTHEKDVSNLFKFAATAFERVDILVNNAGLVQAGAIDELSVELWDRVVDTNLKGTFLCSREAFRIMKSQRSGRIINIGSVSAQRPRVNSAPYSASKFGVWGLTLATALEARPFGISVCCLHPGNVKVEVPGSTDLSPPTEPAMEVHEIVEVALLMASLPPHINMLETIVLPVGQPYLGRG
jgi:NAD(P)-dependent dehydrogenase (short-subunit alcohol dehydrogenase family)